MKLARLKGSDRLFPASPYNRHNALAAKLLAAERVTRTVILSGWQSNKGPPDREPDEHEKREMQVSEGDLMAEIYRRVRGKHLSCAADDYLNGVVIVDRLARTTVGNIISGLNILDAVSGGYWEGSLGIMSADAQLPRTVETARAFGLRNVTVISARQVLVHYGYRADRLFPSSGPVEDVGEDEMLRGNLTGLLNLQRNPWYVTYDLPKIDSDRRLQAVAAGLKRYYEERGIALPQAYELLPAGYDPDYDYAALRREFAQVPLSKHAYPDAEHTRAYEQLVTSLAEQTENLLAAAGS